MVYEQVYEAIYDSYDLETDMEWVGTYRGGNGRGKVSVNGYVLPGYKMEAHAEYGEQDVTSKFAPHNSRETLSFSKLHFVRFL